MFSRQVCISLYDWFATWILLLAVWIVLTGGEAGPAQAYTNLTLYLLVSRGARGPFATDSPSGHDNPVHGRRVHTRISMLLDAPRVWGRS